MNLLLTVVLATVVGAGDTNQTTLTEQQLGDKLSQAVLFARVGLYAEAEAACKEILAQKPDQPTVKELLAEIQERQRRRQAEDPGYALRRKLETMMMPEVHFRAAAAEEVIEYLGKESQRLAPDKEAINFVWQVPADAKLGPVTLNLKNVPMTDVLEYVTKLAGLNYRVDARAVVIYKAEPTRPIPPATEPNVKPQ
jgi:hypothetical protein